MGKNIMAKAENKIAYRIGQAKREQIHGVAVGKQYLQVFYDGYASGLKGAWYDVTGKIWEDCRPYFDTNKLVELGYVIIKKERAGAS